MYLPESVLSSPLLEEDYRVFLSGDQPGVNVNYKGGRAKHIRRAVQSYLSHPSALPLEALSAHNARLTPWLCSLGREMISEAESSASLSKTLKIVRDYSSALAAGLARTTMGSTLLAAAIRKRSMAQTPMMNTHYRDAVFWQSIVELGSASARDGSTWVEWHGILVNSSFTVIPHVSSTEGTLLTHNATLMMKDLSWSRFIIAVCAEVLPDYQFLSSALSEYITWADNLLHKYGNDAYELLKMVEAMCKVWIIRDSEPLLDGNEQLEEMKRKYTQKERKLISKVQGSGPATAAGDFVNILDHAGTPQATAEIFGFLKLSGHPYVDPIKGCKSARELAQREIPLRSSDCDLLEWSFCHVYTKGYIKNHGHWPELTFERPGGVKTVLEQLAEAGQPSLPMGLTLYPPSDWQHARFSPHQPFDYGEDILSLISDKALSNKRTEFDSPWFGSLPYNPPRETTKRRVVEELLARPSFSLRSWCDTVSRREVGVEHLIVTVSPKEREMKLEPRMFAMMTLEMRSFFVLLEHNIAEGIFKEMQEQTMTSSRSELLDMFLEATSVRRGQAWTRLFVEVDFSRWNLNWRDQVIGPIGHRLDQIYGTVGLYTYVHEFFSSAMILLRSGMDPPTGLTSANRTDPPASEKLWYNHSGGFEGIAQKLWTAATIANIHMALWPLGLSYKIAGQADNQVCIVDIPTAGLSQSERAIKLRALSKIVKAEIARVSLLVGQEVKPEECIESTCFMTYGKEMWLKGAYLSTTAKYISRLFPVTTAEAPSLYSYLSGVGSGGIAACDRGSDTLSVLLVTKIMECITIRRELSYSLLHGERLHSTMEDLGFLDRMDDLVLLSLVVPGNLGGFPVSTPVEFMQRGHPDPLSSSFASLSLFSGMDLVRRYAQLLTKKSMYRDPPPLEALILDPYSIPLRMASLSSSVVSGKVRDILIEITRNRDIRPMCLGGSPGARRKVFDFILSLQPCHPKLWHDIYKASPAGVADAFSRRFTYNSTLLTLSRGLPEPIGVTSARADLIWFNTTILRLTAAWKMSSASTYPAGYLPDITRKFWGCSLEGLGCIHPLLKGHIHLYPPSDGIEIPQGCFGQGLVACMSPHNNSANCTSERGPYKPYLGSDTSEKAVAKWVKPVDSSPPVRDVLKLLMIRNLSTIEGSLAWNQLTKLAQTRSAIDIGWLELSTKMRVGGTDGHRYSMAGDDRGTYVASSPNWSSNMVISSNLAGVAGKEDFRVSFQQELVVLLCLTAWGLSHTDTPPPFGGVKCFSLDDTDRVTDRLIEWSGPEIPPPDISGDSYYLRVSSLSFSLRGSRLLKQPLVFNGFPTTDPTVQSALSCIMAQHTSSPAHLFRLRGRTWARVDNRQPLDVAELAALTWDQLCSEMGRLCLVSAAWRVIPAATSATHAIQLIRQTCESYCRRIVPRFAGCIDGLSHEVSPTDLRSSFNRTDSKMVLASAVALTYIQATRGIEAAPVCLWMAGGGDMAHQLSNGLLLKLMQGVLSGTVTLATAKLLRRVVLRCLATQDDVGKVYNLTWLIRSVGLTSWFTVSETPPQMVLRTLRGGRVQDNTRIAPVPAYSRACVTVPTQSTLELTSRPLIANQPRPFTPLELIESWSLRPASPRSSSIHRWRPIYREVPNGASVLVVGIGLGGVSSCFPRSCRVIGLDLSSQIAGAGQAFTTYIPPLVEQPFVLHSCSWLTSGDIYSTECQSRVASEIKSGKYDMVILDMEAGTPKDRLELRWGLAKAGQTAGTRVYCRVLTDRQSVIDIVNTVQASPDSRDRAWVPQIGLGREVVVGGGVAPLGLYHAAGAGVIERGMLSPAALRQDETGAAIRVHAGLLGIEWRIILEAQNHPGMGLQTGIRFRGGNLIIDSSTVEEICSHTDEFFSSLGRHSVRSILSLSILLFT